MLHFAGIMDQDVGSKADLWVAGCPQQAAAALSVLQLWVGPGSQTKALETAQRFAFWKEHRTPKDLTTESHKVVFVDPLHPAPILAPLSPSFHRTARPSTALAALATRQRTTLSGSPPPNHGPQLPTPRR